MRTNDLARFGLAVVLALCAAPSWAAGESQAGSGKIPALRAEPYAVEERFERAFVIELADRTSAVAEMTCLASQFGWTRPVDFCVNRPALAHHAASTS